MNRFPTAVLLASALALLASPDAWPAPPRVPVLVELFTSEGCSSCPAADDALAAMQSTQPIAGAQIIALGFHVDYWDRLGWRDPFSSSEFTSRQLSYGEVFHLDGVYTPQLVIDGSRQLVGGSRTANEQISAALRAPKAKVEISMDAGHSAPELRVDVSGIPAISPGDEVQVVLAITEGKLHSDVLRGENSGRKLSHASVVRRLEVIGQLAQGASQFSARAKATLDSRWKRDAVQAVAFVQERKSRRVLGSAALALAAAN